MTALRPRGLWARVAASLRTRRRANGDAIRLAGGDTLRQSEERLRLALSAGRFGDWQLDLPDLAFTPSDQCKASFGRRPDEPFTPEMFRTAVHPDDWERVEAAVLHAVRTLGDYEADYRVVWPDDSIHWVNARGRAFGDSSGRPLRMVGVTLDITERKQAEQALEESRRRLQAVLDVLPLPLFIADATGRVFQANPAASEVWHRAPLSPRTDAYREDCKAWWPSTGRRVESHEWGMARAVGKGETVIAEEMQVESRDGSRRTILNYAKPIRDGDGRVSGGVAVNVDITERMRVEQALRESEERLRLALQGASAGVWALDVPTGRVFWSEEFPRLYGYDGEKPFSVDEWLEAVHPDDRARVESEFRVRLRSADTEFRQDFRIVHPRRGVRWILSIGRIQRDSRGAAVHCDGLNIDITERKQAEDALREADRRKDEFLATLAHELRNPLAPLRSGLEVMKLAGDDARATRQARDMMERQLRQMVRLIDDLLDVSRISRGRVELRRERVTLARVMQSALETVRPLVEQGGHQVDLRIPSEPILVEADVTRLAQVFANLLCNAVKFTEKGGHVWLSAACEADEVVVKVRDDGVGIPAHMLGEVFEMFTQVDSSPERSHGGLGIGLALVKRLVEMHGGSVEARSAGRGLGSEFLVRLPLVASPTGESERIEVHHEDPSGRRRILVVDDNEDAATSLAMMLEIMGNETRTAHDGLEALAAAGSFRPDVVLLDIGMPRMNGYDAARRLREQPWGRAVVLVALTGWGNADDRRRSQQAGFDFHLVKPVEPSSLRNLLAEL